ncbi:MAG: tripartite tricarboxylate transporter substrate-binding protein [Afipia sp.]|nr:tripartite tricarboxylate transporter substrate-binding protein [Afipia sp.]
MGQHDQIDHAPQGARTCGRRACSAFSCAARLRAELSGEAGHGEHPVRRRRTTDVIGRIICEKLQQRLGKAFVIENRAGAGGNTGVAALAHAAPDGYRIGMTTVSTHGINPNLYKDKLPFRAIGDFEFLSLSSSQPNFRAIPISSVSRTVSAISS